MSHIAVTQNGMVYKNDSLSIMLDPRTVDKGVAFVSHAHMDHLPSSNHGMVLASYQTAKLAKHRGYDLGECSESIGGVKLYDSGHILGSRGLLVGDTFYTGDICARDRGFLRGARAPRCRTLITECTFGIPEFVLPPIQRMRAQVDELISMLYGRGVPVVLMGYQLGKAQTLSELFAHWEPMYYHDSVLAMNRLHRTLGVNIKEAPGHTEAIKAGLLDKKPWIMIAPMHSAKSKFVATVKRYGAVTIAFSGWAASSRFPYSRGADYFIPLSDHSDYPELIRMVKMSGAEKVYTVHGFTSEFAADLRHRGFDAQPLDTSVTKRRL